MQATSSVTLSSSTTSIGSLCVRQNGLRKRDRDTEATSDPPMAFSFDILKRIVKLGRQHSSYLWSSDTVHVMYDAFPKASVHLLLLPTDTDVDSLAWVAHQLQQSQQTSSCVGGAARIEPSSSLMSSSTEVAPRGAEERRDVPHYLNLLETMDAVATAILARLQEQYPSLSFQAGYHSLPSLKHLHMHVMSQDFHKSPFLKHKKHYNSFASGFFVPSKTVVSIMRSTSNSFLDMDAAGRRDVARALDAPLRCFWCGAGEFKTMPSLLTHLGSCSKCRCR